MRDVEFRVLGPFEVLVEGRALELKRRKQRSLLALLLLHTGEVLSTDRLVEELWAGKPPKAAVGSLQNLVSDLRKTLGPDAVVTRPPGYVLDVDRDRVDLHRFERLVAQAAEGGDAERRSTLLRESLALWRGPPLADLAFEPFAHLEIARLEELRTTAREELIQAELELGRHAQQVGELEALVAEHPLRERLRTQLMLALYRSGRQAEALEAYRQARETLVEELGIEPSSELQGLEQSILRHDPVLDLPAPATSESAPAGDDRRKTVTILSTDIVDSPSLGAALDPEVLRSVMRRYFDTVRTIVERHGGTLEKFAGDTAMAVFGVPQVHEDDALRAVRAVTELSEALSRLNADLVRDHGLAIRIRSGINTGEVLAGDPASGEPSATGAAVTVAMHLQQAALPGETLLGEITRSLLHEAAVSEPVEPIDAGGSLGKVQAFRLLALGESTGLRPRAGTSLVGRQKELALLRGAFESVRDDRRSRVVVILGEAGIGKTRLASDFVSLLDAEARALVGRCVSYGEGATYLPLAEIVRQAAPTRPQATITALLGGDEHAALIAERMAELTGQVEGAAPTGELFWAVRRFFEALARERPLVVVLEDVHWAEPTLLDLVEYLAAWISDAPILVLCIARPELLEKRPGWESSTETITLDPLSAAEAEALLAELAEGEEVSEQTRDRIVAVAEGNALFVEQLLAYVTEGAGEAFEETIPPSIEALVAGRLDRLEPEDRAVLERAAVIGKDFARSAVRHLSPPEELPSVDSRLGSLDRHGLIHPQRSRMSPDEGFRFHHVLIRDVTYAGITKERRADLHERHGTWLEQRHEADELVGYHAEQSHRYLAELRPDDVELGRLAGWAGDHLAVAGIRAWKRADTPAAVNLLERAVGLLPPGIPRGEALCELAVALRTAGRIDEAEDALQQAIEMSAGHERRLELRARIELAQIGLLVDPEGQSAELLELAATAIPLFEELGDDRALGRTWLRVAYVRGGVLGDNSERQDAAERALLHYRRSGWSPATCLGELGAALYHGPTPVTEAVRRCEELLQDAVSDRASEANVLVFKGGLEAMRGRFDEARRLVTTARAIFEEIGMTTAIANFCGAMGGAIEIANEDYAAAERILRESCDSLEHMREHALLASRAAELAEALCALGRFDEADHWLLMSEQHAASDDVDAQSAWRAVGAEVKAGTGNLSEAETLAGEAVRLAEKTDMLNRRGRTLLVLAEVLRRQSRFDEAAQPIEHATRIFERKGNVVAARRARGLFDELVLS